MVLTPGRSRLARELDGDEEQHIATLADGSTLHPRQIRVALDHAAAHPDPIQDRTTRNERQLRRAVGSPNSARRC